MIEDTWNTMLTFIKEIDYQIQKANSPFKNDSGYDYDLRGFYNKYGTLQPQSTNGHLTDEFKKPIHDTFSTQSNYYTEQSWAIEPEGYTYIPDRLDDNFFNNGLQPFHTDYGLFD